jgi:hypothetical protein
MADLYSLYFSQVSRQWHDLKKIKIKIVWSKVFLFEEKSNEVLS